LLPRVAEALAAAGRAEEAHALLLEALELTAPEDVRATVALVVACAGTENLLGRHEQALRRLLSARARIGSDTREAVLVDLELATYGVLMNDMRLACDCAGRAQDRARARGEAALQASAAALLCAARSFSGDTAAAIAARGEATRLLAVLDDEALVERSELLFFLGWAEWGLGLVADAESRNVRGIELSHATGRAQWLIQQMLGRIMSLTWMGRLDEALEVSEEWIEARAWARRAAAGADATDLPFARAFADRAEARVLLAAGDSGAAAVLAERSAAHALAVGARVESARANVLGARAHADAGNRERAAELLRTAEIELAACGAQRYRLQAVRELRRIGRRVHVSAKHTPSARAGLASLSGREREVAERLRDHMTNRQIAGELFLAEKTVESHLRSIFVKLGVDSRARVARAVEQAAVRPS
jgi:DNA-binding NarL/FixJ family response regulator